MLPNIKHFEELIANPPFLNDLERECFFLSARSETDQMIILTDVSNNFRLNCLKKGLLPDNVQLYKNDFYFVQIQGLDSNAQASIDAQDCLIEFP